jgi:hypothetical protein
MKCPKCSKESTKKERVGGQCPQCRWAFRFDPPEPLSDFEMEHAIQTVSANGTFRYTRSQLVAEVERVLVKRATRIYENEAQSVLESDRSFAVWYFVAGLLAVGSICLFVFREMCGTPLLVMAVGVAVFRLLRRNADVVAAELRAKIPTDDPRASTLTDRYLAGQNLTLLVDAPTPTSTPAEIASRELGPVAQRREFDLESYGFDRVIVVQGNDLVDMLVKNQFHFQHNAAIVSFAGYPRHVAELIDREISRPGSEASVFLVHAASAEGRGLVRSFREKYTMVKQMYDVGLSEAHVATLWPRRAVLDSRPASPGAGDGAAEARENVPHLPFCVELAALRPKQLMTLLFNALTRAAQSEASAADAGPMLVGEANGDSFEAPLDTVYDFG